MSKRKDVFLLILRGIFGVGLTVALVFVLAGRWDYWQGWGFCAAIAVLTITIIIMFADKMDLIRDRRKPGPGTKWWDKILFYIFGPLWLIIICLGILDAGRYRWTSHIPVVVYVLSYIIFLLSVGLFLWAMYVNRFFSSVVRIQKDRGHELVTDGPYRYVRHPGYVGGILGAVSVSLMLGSLWVLIPCGFFVLIMLIRTFLEDNTLKKELPGYTDYSEKVKYRLIPGIW